MHPEWNAFFYQTGDVQHFVPPSDSLRSHAVPFYIKKAHCICNVLFCKTGDVLLSQAAARQVSSAQKSLTTVFEMGTGVSSSL